MLTHSDLRKGALIILEGEPYEILEAQPMKKAQRRVVIQARIKSLISGSVISQNFHQGDTFEEAEMIKFTAKFLYKHRDKFFFCKEDNPAERFEMTEDKIGAPARFLKPNQIVQGLIFNEKIINIAPPIKISLEVTEAPPGERGGRAQAGTKQVVLESGATINAPLFIEKGDIIELNTETGEYVRRVE